MLVHKTRRETTVNNLDVFRPLHLKLRVCDVVLTFAGVGGSAVVEPSLTVLTVPTLRVVQTLQTLAAAAIAASRHSDVDVAVTFAGLTGLRQSVATWRFTVETLLTDVTART